MNRADGNSLPQHRRGEHRPNADTSGETRWKVTFWHCCQVINVKGSPVNYGSGGYRVTVDWNEFPTPPSRQRPVISHWSELVAINAMNHGVSCIAQPRGIFGNNIEHRLNISRRASNHAENFTGRRLLLK